MLRGRRPQPGPGHDSAEIGDTMSEIVAYGAVLVIKPPR
jgi:hypothetical protein